MCMKQWRIKDLINEGSTTTLCTKCVLNILQLHVVQLFLNHTHFQLFWTEPPHAASQLIYIQSKFFTKACKGESQKQFFLLLFNKRTQFHLAYSTVHLKYSTQINGGGGSIKG